MSTVRRRVEDCARPQVSVLQEKAIAPSATLKEDLGMDSLDIAGFVIELEAEFGIAINTDETEALITLGDPVALVEWKIGRRSR